MQVRISKRVNVYLCPSSESDEQPFCDSEPRMLSIVGTAKR